MQKKKNKVIPASGNRRYCFWRPRRCLQRWWWFSPTASSGLTLKRLCRPAVGLFWVFYFLCRGVCRVDGNGGVNYLGILVFFFSCRDEGRGLICDSTLPFSPFSVYIFFGFYLCFCTVICSVSGLILPFLTLCFFGIISFLVCLLSLL